MSLPSRWMNESKRAYKKREQNMQKQKEKHDKKMQELLSKKESK